VTKLVKTGDELSMTS